VVVTSSSGDEHRVHAVGLNVADVTSPLVDTLFDVRQFCGAAALGRR